MPPGQGPHGGWGAGSAPAAALPACPAGQPGPRAAAPAALPAPRHGSGSLRAWRNPGVGGPTLLGCCLHLRRASAYPCCAPRHGEPGVRQWGHRELGTPPDPHQEPGEPGTTLLRGLRACRASDAPAQTRATNSPWTNPWARGACDAPSPGTTGTGSQQRPRAGTPRGRQCPTSPCTDPKRQHRPGCIHPPALLSPPSQGPQQ